MKDLVICVGEGESARRKSKYLKRLICTECAKLTLFVFYRNAYPGVARRKMTAEIYGTVKASPLVR